MGSTRGPHSPYRRDVHGAAANPDSQQKPRPNLSGAPSLSGLDSRPIVEPSLVNIGRPHRRSIIYVAGYGRSGSTVLDIALSSHEHVLGLGELNKAFGVLAGPDAPDSGFWGTVANLDLSGAGRSATPTSALGDAHATVRAVEGALTGLWHRIRGSKRRLDYLNDQHQLLRAAFAQPGVSAIVDSSKTSRASAWRVPLLVDAARADDIDAEIHCVVLVRRLGDVIRSIRSGRGDDQRPLSLPTLRAMFGWVSATSIAVVVGLRSCGRNHTRLLRYEQFCADPGAALGAIYDWAGLPIDDRNLVLGLEEGFVPGDQIYGNRVRHSRTIKIQQQPNNRIGGPLGLLVSFTEFVMQRLVLRRVPPISDRS